LKSDPNKALTKKTFEGEKRSAIVKIAKIKVPMINHKSYLLKWAVSVISYVKN
jgi:hypothetical protein